MALEDKLETLINLLTQEAQSSKKNTKKSRSASTDVNVDDLKASQASFAKVTQDIEKKYENIKKSTADIIDKEEILQQLKKEHVEAAEDEFTELQKQVLILNEKIVKGKELTVDEQNRLKYAETRLKRLKQILDDNQKEIEQNKKLEEQKQKIKIVGEQILANAKKYSLEIERHLIEMGKLTGGVEYFGEASKASMDLFASTVGTGITGEQAMKAMQNLNKEFTNSISFGSQAVSQMSLVTAQLEKIGVSGATAGKNFDTLVNAMGKTPFQAGKIQESFVQMAAKNKLALSSVTEAFSVNSSRFVGYGEQMTKVLDGLAQQALQTGIQINNLVQIASGFDTFDDAATKVGNLNALLGGDYFNSIELLTASDEERIKLLKEGVLASGMQWESMNRFQKQAIATSAGIKDLNEAAKLFGSNLTGMTKQQADAAQTQRTLAEQAERASLMTDKLTSMFNGLLIAIQPVVEIAMIFVSVLGSIVNWISKLGEVFGPAGKLVSAFATSVLVLTVYLGLKGGLTGVISLLSTAATALIAKIPILGTAFKASATSAATSTSTLVGVIQALGAAGSAAAYGLLAIGAAALGIGGGIALAAGGLAYLVQSFSGLGENGLWAAAGITAVTIALSILIFKLVALAASTAATGGLGIAALWSIGGAIALIGAGIGTAAAGIGYMISSISSLVASFSSFNTENFDKLFSLFSDDNIKKINLFAEAISKLNQPFIQLNNNLSSIVANLEKMGLDMSAEMSVATSVPEKITTAINATAMTVANTTAAATTQALIPAQQTSYVVPMVVNIGKDKIIEILKSDMEKIAKAQALKESTQMIDALGIVQTAEGIQLRNIVTE